MLIKIGQMAIIFPCSNHAQFCQCYNVNGIVELVTYSVVVVAVVVVVVVVVMVVVLIVGWTAHQPTPNK